MKIKLKHILTLSAVLLASLLFCGCESGENEIVDNTNIINETEQQNTSQTADVDINSVEKNVVFTSGMNFSGYKRPVVDNSGQHLSEEPIAEAEEGKIVYTVNYKSAGKIEGWKVQEAGKESNIVTALPNLGYKFVKWSDGYTEPSRSGDTEEGLYTAIFDYDILDMPIIVINTDSGKAISSKTEYADATISLYGCESKYEIDNMAMQIRGRGNNSWGYPKKSYKFKLETKNDLLNLGDGKEKIWVLLANQCDQSLQRNHVSFELGRYFEGIDWEPASTSVEVYLNGEYVGVYLLAEDIKVSKNRVDIEEGNVDEIDTGYLLELSNYASGEVITAAGRTYMIHSDLSEDKNIKNQQRNYIKDYVNDAYEALGSGSYEEADELIDLDSLLAAYLTEEIVKNLDSQWDSFYLYKDVGGKLFFGPVWDFDLSLGNANEGEEVYNDIFVGNGRGSGGSLATWFAVAMMQDWFRQLVQDKWVEIYDSLCELPKFIIDEGELGFRSYERNFEKWKIFGTVQNRETHYITRLKNYKEHYEYLAQWLTDRLEWLNDAFLNEKFVSDGEGLFIAMMNSGGNHGNHGNSWGNSEAKELSEEYDNLTTYIRIESVVAPDGFDNEGVENLSDSDKNTKYCVDYQGDIEITFTTKKLITVEAYLLRTANDTAENSSRNPDAWTFYGSEDGENWVEITHEDKGEELLEAKNYMWYGFECQNPGLYKYYKFVFENEGIMQLSEIRLLGSK